VAKNFAWLELKEVISAFSSIWEKYRFEFLRSWQLLTGNEITQNSTLKKEDPAILAYAYKSTLNKRGNKRSTVTGLSDYRRQQHKKPQYTHQQSQF
jgi:hypothetical protein